MENTQKTFAIIKDGIVENAIVGEALAIVQALLPEANLVEVTESTGVAYIGGPFVDGSFIPPKPYESWTLDSKAKAWKAPIQEPALDPGFYVDWNEESGTWDIKEIPVANETE
jgi:hypothetical protein